MPNPLDLKRLAVRIEGLLHTRTHGWAPADEMEFKSLLPTGRDRRKLPEPARLNQMADDREEPSLQDFRLWIQIAMKLDGLKQQNDPRNPKRIMRDMARGRWPF